MKTHLQVILKADVQPHKYCGCVTLQQMPEPCGVALDGYPGAREIPVPQETAESSGITQPTLKKLF
jgi:hypothetical protein